MQIELFLCDATWTMHPVHRGRAGAEENVFAFSRRVAILRRDISLCVVRASWGAANRAIINVTNYTLDTLPEESSPSHSTIALTLT